jgi:hypothetical protein
MFDSENYAIADIELTRRRDSSACRATYDRTSDGPLSVFVARSVEQMNRERGVASSEILADAIDPDALDALFGRRASDDLTVRFTVDGYAVEVRSGGRVSFDVERESRRAR